MKELPPIYFYIPREDWPPSGLPADPDSYWTGWENGGYGLMSGVYAWVIITYLRLQAAGFPCMLLNHLPAEGIVIANRVSFADFQRPTDKLFMICIKSDKSLHPFAQMHIVENKKECLCCKQKVFKQRYYIPHWPQPELLAREKGRGEKFENIVYIGTRMNLASELKSSKFEDSIKALGLQWRIVEDKTQWNDYRHVDAILAVREFNRGDYLEKPHTKLINAWRAGVPAILGAESAYQAGRKSDLDYIEVRSLDETLDALRRIRDDKELRRKMVENGKIRAQEFTPEKITEKWKDFLLNMAVPEYEKWCRASFLERRLFFMRRSIYNRTKRLRHIFLATKGLITTPIKKFLSRFTVNTKTGL